MADRMMNRGSFKRSLIRKIYELLFPDLVMNYLRCMRKYSFYCHVKESHGCGRLISVGLYMMYKFEYNRLSHKMGCSIGVNTCGYGLVLHHYGTIVIGSNNEIGNYANILPCTCIIKNESKIGNFFFMGYGSVITKKIQLGDNCKIAANSVVNRCYSHDNCVIVGSPADVKKIEERTWMEMYSGQDGEWISRWRKVEELKTQMKI